MCFQWLVALLQDFKMKELLLGNKLELLVVIKLCISAAHYLPWAVPHMQPKNACVVAAKDLDF